MTILTINNDNKLYYLYEAPKAPTLPTFVFVNALTGDTSGWENIVAPTLREHGFGTLSYDFRGQKNSSFNENIELTPTLIVDDLQFLIQSVAPQKPILVGLSIGGIFAAHAVLKGLCVEGLVLLNTLREIGPRISWVNDALPEMVSVGGIPLFLDAMFPLLVNQEFAAAARPNFLKGDYAPLEAKHGHVNLMRNAGATQWDIDYSELTLPTLVVTGLEDRVFLDREVVARLLGDLPRAQHEEWENAGHLLPLERPERLVASLQQFAVTLEEGGL